MSRHSHSTKNFSLKSHKVNWPVVINCPDHFTSTIPVSISSTGVNIIFTEKGVLQWSRDTGEFSHGGTPLKNGKLETLQWDENSATRTSYDHSDRCLNKRLGAYYKGVSTGEKWPKEEKHFHINVLELLALKFAILTFTKNLSHLTIHVQVGNKVALAYLFHGF